MTRFFIQTLGMHCLSVSQLADRPSIHVCHNLPIITPATMLRCTNTYECIQSTKFLSILQSRSSNSETCSTNVRYLTVTPTGLYNAVLNI